MQNDIFETIVNKPNSTEKFEIIFCSQKNKKWSQWEASEIARTKNDIFGQLHSSRWKPIVD